MSRPKRIWWGYAKAMIRQYPQMEKHIIDIYKLPKVKQKEFESVTKAISLTKKRRNADNRLQVISLVLWQSGFTLAQAAARLYISEATAYRYHRDFVMLVGECYGLTD